jgi:hypothetical protein
LTSKVPVPPAPGTPLHFPVAVVLPLQTSSARLMIEFGTFAARMKYCVPAPPAAERMV